MTTSPYEAARLAELMPPTLADIEAIADAAFAALPQDFRMLCDGVVILTPPSATTRQTSVLPALAASR